MHLSSPVAARQGRQQLECDQGVLACNDPAKPYDDTAQLAIQSQARALALCL